MQKRRYTRIKAVEAEILRMHSEWGTHRSIAEVFGLEREQVKKFLKRHRERTRPCCGKENQVSLKGGHERIDNHQGRIQKQN